MLIPVVSLDELKQKLKMRVMIDQTPVLLLFFMDKVYAISDKCPHLGISLEQGRYDDIEGKVTCRGHGATIDIRTGHIVEKAHLAIFKLPTKMAKTFEVIVDNNQVYLQK
jgi:nitrite reductase/ring-hydroxylating ferredoxin subunit